MTSKKGKLSLTALYEINTSPVVAPNFLTGEALLQKLKELSHLSRTERAKECGYYTETQNGETRVNLTDFYDAILAAKGVNLGSSKIKDNRKKEPTFRISVNKNGQIIIGSIYTEQMGLKPGDEFEIQLGYQHIHLKQIKETSVESEQPDYDPDFVATMDAYQEIKKRYHNTLKALADQ